MNLKKLAEGFTLVEMLVVIAIIAILASALFPAITNAMDQATSTALKNKGRGIWVAINSANMEREPLNLAKVWPSEAVKNKKCADKDSAAYFTYLLSDDATTGSICDEAEDRVVSDLTPETLIGSGIVVGSGSIKNENTAWVVTDVGDNSAAEMPFLFTRNIKSTEIEAFNGDADDTTGATKIELQDVKPFGTKRAVWVTRGGGTLDARAKFLTNQQILGGIKTNCTVWAMSSAE